MNLNDKLVEYIENIQNLYEKEKHLKRCDIKTINDINNKFYEETKISKSQLINKIIRFVGPLTFEGLKNTTVIAYNDIFQKVIKMSSELFNETNDPMFLVGYLTIITEWHLYQSLDIKEYKEPERNKEA